MGNDFEAERSKALTPGPTSGLRGALPYCSVARAKPAALNHTVGERCEEGNSACCPAARFGRDSPLTGSTFWLSPLWVTLNGSPLCSVIRPPSDQPPA